MDIKAEQVLQSALGLDPNERAEIAASLISSLDANIDTDADVAWAEEVKRRLESIDRGEAQLFPAAEVMRAMRERLDG